MTIAKAKTILRKDIRCFETTDCYGNCIVCKKYVPEEQVIEAEKVVLELVDSMQEHIKQQKLCGSGV